MAKEIIDAWPHWPTTRQTIPSGEDPANPNGWQDNLNRIAQVVNGRLQEPTGTIPHGALIYYDAATGLWAALAPGTAGQILQVVAGKPTWAAFGQSEGKEHAWAIPGPIAVASGDVDYIVPFYVHLKIGQTLRLVGARHRLNAGTSATVKVQKNGADVTGLTGIAVTTSSTTTTPAYNSSQDLADGDMLALVVTAVSGAPQNLSFTLFLDPVA